MVRSRICARGCRGGPVYKFPDGDTERFRRNLWVERLGVLDNKKTLYACARHFSQANYLVNGLRKNAVPDLMLGDAYNGINSTYTLGAEVTVENENITFTSYNEDGHLFLNQQIPNEHDHIYASNVILAEEESDEFEPQENQEPLAEIEPLVNKLAKNQVVLKKITELEPIVNKLAKNQVVVKKLSPEKKKRKLIVEENMNLTITDQEPKDEAIFSYPKLSDKTTQTPKSFFKIPCTKASSSSVELKVYKRRYLMERERNLELCHMLKKAEKSMFSYKKLCIKMGRHLKLRGAPIGKELIAEIDNLLNENDE